MNKNSDVYVVIYTVILTIVCGTLLALASEGLKPYKEKNIALDLKKNILATTMDISGKPAKEIEDLYKKLVKAEYVVDQEGSKVKTKVDAVNVLEEYSLKKDDPNSRLLPVYEVATLDNPEATSYYVFPMYGFGLWDYIWGYVSFDTDFSAIKGTVFAHKGETAGLGARIATKEIQDRFIDKKVFKDGQLSPVQMQKGEGNDYSGDEYKVDGLSGATLTAQGVNNMFNEYLAGYKLFIEKQKGSLSLAQ